MTGRTEEMIGETGEMTDEQWAAFRIQNEANRHTKNINDSFSEGRWSEEVAKLRYARQTERIDAVNTSRYNPDGTLKMNIDSFPDLPRWKVTQKTSYGRTFEYIERETDDES